MENHEPKQGIAIDSYLKQIENFEIELNEQELQDLRDLNELQKQMNGADLSAEIWGTIKQAALDSVEQMIGLDFRGDCRPDEGAIITTPLNFEKGIVASDADRKRFEMWKDRVNETYEKPYEFRERVIKPDFNKKREEYKNKIRQKDGSYIDGYTGKPIYDRNDPRAYSEPDASGDMKLDTTKTIDIDHNINVAKNQKDSKVALCLGETQEKFETDFKELVNDESNFSPTSTNINRSMGDQDTMEYAQENPDKGLNPELVREKQEQAKKHANKVLFDKAIKEKSIEFAKNIGTSTLAATGKYIIGTSMRISINEFYHEFIQNDTEKTFIERLKEVYNKIYKRIKEELIDDWNKIVSFASSNAISEIVNLIINYFVTTVKNVFKLIRCMIGSIIKAFKIILDKTRPWEERLFEALKIISAGLTLASGTILNELLDKAISTNLPFLAPISGDISAVISGLISSILSALVLMAFDKYKESIEIKNNEAKMQLITMRLTGNSNIRSYLNTMRTEICVADTVSFVFAQIAEMGELNLVINDNIDEFNRISDSINKEENGLNVLDGNQDESDDILDKMCGTIMN